VKNTNQRLAEVDDHLLLEGLLRREEQAFVQLVYRYQPSLLRFARVYLRTPELAEEAVQDTWIAVLEGIERFEGRSSLRTWILSILMNRARSMGRREAKHASFAAGFDPSTEPGEPAVDPLRFFQRENRAMEGHWSTPPSSWGCDPETALLRREVLDLVEGAIAELPPGQREVITLRDIEGWPAREVCDLLRITETNQRVLLHRARSRVRNQLEEYQSSQ
jgi:RNA polymerase sigma-70 factor (ECF subfamily)